MAGYPQYSHHALIAGLIGGYTVWGRYTSMNYQIVLYLSSRVLVALMQRLATTLTTRQHQQKELQHQDNNLTTRNPISFMSFQQLIKDRIYTLSATTIWGIVMFLFEDSPEFLHPSLRSSMDEIYRFSNQT
jgi:peroxisomal membrane protein 4